MDLNKLSVFHMLTTRMRWLSDRQSVIAHNVANADTPHFESRDMKPMDFRAVLRQSEGLNQLEATRTSSGHMQGVASNASISNAEAPTVRHAPTTPTGNTVVLEHDMEARLAAPCRFVLPCRPPASGVGSRKGN